MKLVRRNATRQLAALKASHTKVRVYTLDNHFSGEELASADYAWASYERFDFAKLYRYEDGHLVVHVHDNLWYELREPVASVWVKSTSHRSREQLMRACDRAGVRRPASWFRQAKDPRQFRNGDEYFEVPTTVGIAGIKGLVVLKSAILAAELIRPIRF